LQLLIQASSFLSGQFIHFSGIGLASAELHHLANEKAPPSSCRRDIVSNLFGIGGDDFINDLIDSGVLSVICCGFSRA